MYRYVGLYFTTATILNWYPLLRDDEFKDIIIESLRFQVRLGRIAVLGFVIMPNHIHLIWQIYEPDTLSKMQYRLLKYTAQQFKFRLIDNHDDNILVKFLVNKGDRKYQFWQKKTYSFEIYNGKTLNQKMSYLLENPVRKRLVSKAEEYKYSSAKFYLDGIQDWDFVI